MRAKRAFCLKILHRKILDCMLASLAFCWEILLRKIPSGKGLNRLNSSSQTQMRVITLIWPFLKVTEKSRTVRTKWDVKWMSEFFNNSFHHFQVRTARGLKFRLSQDLPIHFPRRLKITAKQFRSENRLRRENNAWEQLSLSADQSTPRTGAGAPTNQNARRSYVCTYGKEINIRCGFLSLWISHQGLPFEHKISWNTNKFQPDRPK